MTDDPRTPGPGDPEQPGLPEELAKVLRELTGGADLPPELVSQLQSMGIADADPAMLGAMAQQMKAMFDPTRAAKGVDREHAVRTAREVVAADGADRVMTDRERGLAEQAVRVAGLWLDEITSLEAPALVGRAMSRAEWVEATLPLWAGLVEPVADGVSAAIRDSFTGRLEQSDLADLGAMGLPPGLDPAMITAQMGPMVDRMSSTLVTMQLGQAVGALAGDTVTGTEAGIPLLTGEVVVLPVNIAELAEGLEVDLDEVWLHLAVRESARMRLFTAVPWLGPQILEAVGEYARGIAVDTDAVDAAVARIDPSDPAGLQDALAGTLFNPEPSAAQRAALTRLETWLALTEGWVDVVTERASRAHLPHTQAMLETIRRRRATGGPAERTFASLVGLELRPRRLRDAANLFAALEDAHGPQARDAAWSHPDLAPTAADLDDVLGYVERAGVVSSLDDELDAFLRSAAGEGPDAPAPDTDDDRPTA